MEITLPPANAHEWRAPRASRGTLRTFDYGAQCLITDGIVAWFILDSGKMHFGHLADFVPTRQAREAKPSKADRLRALANSI